MCDPEFVRHDVIIGEPACCPFHCEEHSDEAISVTQLSVGVRDRRASLAMTLERMLALRNDTREW